MLTAVLLFTTAFSLNVIAGAAGFTPRLEAPSYSNEYYYSSKNLYYKYGWGMPNCTAYAYGRAYEILGKEPKLCPYNAEQWYGYNISNGYYSYGQRPALGAIACWSYPYGGGHVAVVEKIDSNGNLTLSNSAYSGTNFYLTYATADDPVVGGSSYWNFQGFIYVYQEPGELSDPYETGSYSVLADTLTLRESAGTSSKALGYISYGTKLNITEIKDGGSYTWGKTVYNGKTGWIALDYCAYLSSEFVEDPTEAPTTVPPTTVAPTTVAPTTVAPTTAAPTTVVPTTVPPTTVPATTAAPTTVEPTTAPQGLGVGDVNKDGRIDITDATAIQKYVAGTLQLSKSDAKLCDFDFDGEVSIVDATCLQHYLTFSY